MWLRPGVGIAGLAGPFAVLAMLLWPSATDGAAPAGVAAVSSDPTAIRLLERAAATPLTTAYHGVQFVSAWSDRGSTSLLVTIDHRPGRGTTVRTRGTAQTPGRTTFLPADASQPSLLGGASPFSLLADNFVVTLAGRRAVAGRPADLVEARRAGAGPPSARFWLDRGTGLVLRREVYDERGRTTRASAFVELEIGRDRPDSAMPAVVPRAWRDAMGGPDLAAIRERGWRCPAALPMSLTLVDARRGGPAGGGIVHLSYSDGLSTVSLFEQQGRLDRDGLDGYRPALVGGKPVFVRDGVPQRLVWSAYGTVYTLVADAPPRTVGAAVAALPHEDHDGSPWRRLGRGLDRVASWFNPFG